MKYVSKIFDYTGSEMYHSNSGYVSVIEIRDSDTNSMIRYNIDDIRQNREVLDGVYGCINQRGNSEFWKITKFDLELYKHVDFVKASRNTRVEQDKWSWFLYPCKALKKSEYTLYDTDTTNFAVESYKNVHTLGGLLLFTLYPTQRFNRLLGGLKIEDNMIIVELFNSTYYYRILDKEKFDLFLVKARTLGLDRS